MKPILLFVTLILMILIRGALLFAQGDPAAELPVEEFLKQLIEAVGGVQGASAIGIVVAVVQIVMLFFRTKLADFAGKYRLLIVYGLSMAGVILGLKLAGSGWLDAILNGNVVAAAQVFAHQIWVQFIRKDD